MKNFVQKWKSLNKIGLKLSLICGLNWLVGFISKSQFYLFSAAFAGVLTYYIPQESENQQMSCRQNRTFMLMQMKKMLING